MEFILKFNKEEHLIKITKIRGIFSVCAKFEA